MDEIIIKFTIIFLVAFTISSLLKKIKIPLIISYLFTGIILGPLMGYITPEQVEYLNIFSELGIILLLFIVGLNLNPVIIRELGKYALASALVQIVALFGITYYIAIILGLNITASLVAALSVVFSSTIVVLKLLADKRELNKLYSKLSLGILIVQDIAATLVLIFLSSMQSDLAINLLFLKILISLLSVAVIVYIFRALFLKPILKYVSESTELLFVFSITYAFVFSIAFESIDFSKEVGALFAGVTLASTIYAKEIAARLKILRDFFAIIFFIILGTHITPVLSIDNIILILALTSLVVTVKPLLIYFVLIMQGITKKTSIYTSLSLAQISEFSLILAAIMLYDGLITNDLFSAITIVFLITSAVSALYIYNLKFIYLALDSISIFFFKPEKKQVLIDQTKFEAIVVGNDVTGQGIARYLDKNGIKTLLIDYNPNKIVADTDNVIFMYADASDIELYEELDLSNLKYFFSTSLDTDTDLLLARKFSNEHPNIYLAIVTIQRYQNLFKGIDIDDLVVSELVSSRHVVSKLSKFIGNS